MPRSQSPILSRKHKIDILNVAGPRQSEWPEGYDYAYRALEIFLTLVATALCAVRIDDGSQSRGYKITRSAAL